VRHTLRTIAAITLAAAVITGTPAHALAQPAAPAATAAPDATEEAKNAAEEAKNAARQLADQGYEHFERGEYQKAIQLFHRADELFHAPTLVLMQGHAQAKSGNIIEARALYQRVTAEALPVGASKEFREAQQEAKSSLEKLEGKTGFLKIVLQGGAPERVQIEVDGIPVPPSRIGQLIEQNPGKRRIVALIDAEEGGRSVFQTVTIKPKRTKQVTIAFRKSGIRVEAEKSDDDDDDTSSEPGSIVPAAISFGVGIAGIGVGAVTGFLWLDKKGAIEEKCGTQSTCPGAENDVSARKTFGTVSIIGLVTGGVGLGLGTVLLLTRSTGEPDPQTAGVSLVVGPGSLGVRGTF
jgi:hypothetical protein